MTYATVVLDPPWEFAWRGGGTVRVNGRGERHVNAVASVKELPYPTMPIAAILALPVGGLAAPDAHLYFWIPDSLLLAGAARDCVDAWGFGVERTRLLVWRKSGWGLGTFPRPQHEILVCSKRGDLAYRVRDEGSVQSWKLVYGRRGRSVGRIHSAKPDGALDLIERASPGPYLEMFARRQRLGWDTWGNEALCHVDLAAAT